MILFLPPKADQPLAEAEKLEVRTESVIPFWLLAS